MSRAEELSDAFMRACVDEILSAVEKLRAGMRPVSFNLLRCLLAERLVAAIRKDGVTYEIV